MGKGWPLAGATWMDNPNEYHQQEMDEEESDTKHMEDHGWGLGMSRDRLCATTQHQGRECPGDVFPPAVTPAWLVEAEAALMPQDGGKVQLPEGCTAQFLLRCFLDGLSDSATAEAKPSGWQQAHGLPSPWRGSRWAKACLAVVNASAGSGSEGQWERMGCLVELCSNGSPPAADALLDAIAEAHHSEDPMPGDQVEARERAGEAMVAASVAAAGRKQWRAARALLGRISCEPSMFCRLLIAMESGGRRVWSWLVATAVEVAEKCRRGITSCRGAEVGGGCLGCAAFLSRLLAAKAEAAGWMLALGLVPRETDAPFLGSALGSVLLPGHMASLLGELESLGQNSPGNDSFSSPPADLLRGSYLIPHPARM